ncbi:type III polyketide synthase [Bacillus alkalicellulosilyticus]|uniref:type III polyketide synthase n=1 Tax=Alkalihalobacterium alkalicellulosilyticum TaxID=1912214 RepID=UPI000997EB63|nr:3-oxoacyl-[acyl-carrier-protein] synthase III C-terminal domain-containing protein [Bacillus alkalicellulosilyticus]
MPAIVSVSTYNPPHTLKQELTTEFARELFEENYEDIDRLLTVFKNGEIKERHFSVPLSWFRESHSLQEKNDIYIELATEYGVKAIEKCLSNKDFLAMPIPIEEIDAIVFVSSTGMSTPSIDARIMNHLPFSRNTKRIPLWGLGCAGGGAGISRAHEFCLAYPDAKVLVVCVELCSLTFQRDDRSKSNLIGTSLFADGVACALVVGDTYQKTDISLKPTIPHIKASHSELMSDSENVMGWNIRDEGLHVVFSRSIPSIIENWLKPVVEKFLEEESYGVHDITHFIAHPGGKKVLEAYEASLGYTPDKTAISKKVLQEHGNMSSPTVLYVLQEYMKQENKQGNVGLMAALGPGFCSELVLLEWQ